MGIFDFFKKKNKPNAQTTSQKIQEAYTPWISKENEPRHDNYAIAAFIKMSLNGATVGKTNDDYARYFSYEYKVFDPIKYHTRIISDGFLEMAMPDIALSKFKVAELKEILAANNLPEKGKKDELIQRIIENVNTDYLRLDVYYVPTQKGLEHLKKYEHLFHAASYGISPFEYDLHASMLPPHLKPNDVIWNILNTTFNDHNIHQNYGLARHLLYQMARFLESENRLVDSLFRYILVLYYDMSGLGNNGSIEKREYLHLSPELRSKLTKCKTHFKPVMLEKCFSTYRLPHHYFSETSFLRLLMNIFEDNIIDLDDY